MVGHELEFHLVVIYIRYQSSIYSLQWNVESTLEINSNKANTSMGPRGPYYKLIHHDDTVYDSWISSKFILMHKGILVNMQGCIANNDN